MAAAQNLIARFDPQTVRSGNYRAQSQLDYRVQRGQTLRILSPAEWMEEHEFQTAMQRRKEDAGLSLAEMANKYGLK